MLLNFILSIKGDSLCDEQFKYIENNSKKSSLFAQRFFDSWGKFPSGIFSGNYYDFGSYDQCINFHHLPQSNEEEIRGKYCIGIFPYDSEFHDERGKFAPVPFS